MMALIFLLSTMAFIPSTDVCEGKVWIWSLMRPPGADWVNVTYEVIITDPCVDPEYQVPKYDVYVWAEWRGPLGGIESSATDIMYNVMDNTIKGCIHDLNTGDGPPPDGATVTVFVFASCTRCSWSDVHWISFEY